MPVTYDCGPAKFDDAIGRDHGGVTMGRVHTTARSAASVAIAAVMLATGLTVAPSASAAALDGNNLVTAAEVDQASRPEAGSPSRSGSSTASTAGRTA